VSIAFFPALCLGQQAKPSIAHIERVWKARQDKVAAARFEIDTEKTIHQGSTSFMEEASRRAAGLPPEPEPNPPRDYLVKGTSRFSLSGAKVRHSYDDQAWDPVGKRLYPKHYVDVFNGQLYKSLDNPSSGQEDYPSGVVKKVPQSGSALKFPLLPLICTLRGNHPQFFRDLGIFRVAGQNVPIAGRPCLELVRGSDRSDNREVLYVDQERDYVLVKAMILVDDHPNWQLDVTYSADATVGWVPRSWEYLIRAGKDNRILSSGRRSVIRYEINPHLDDSEFDIRFPPGTRVDDESSGQYVVYAIQESGEKGRAIPAALGPTYKDLEKAPTRLGRWMLLWGIVALVALAGSIWLRVQRKRRNHRLS
jgi:hypothetical protein